jgi:type I restriction enzyme S subunit
MARAIFKSWFVDFEPFGGTMPEDWQESTLGNHMSIQTGKLDANAQVIGGEYPFFTCAAIPLKIDKFAFDTDAIIVSGNGAYVGYLNHYKGKFNAYQRTYILSEFSIPIYFIWLFLKATLKERIELSRRGSSTPYIVLGTLKDFPFILPNKVTLREFAGTVSPLLEQIATLCKENANLAELRDTLLPRLMSGELSVADLGEAK